MAWRRNLSILLRGLIGLALPFATNADPTTSAKTQTLTLDAARSSADFEVKVLWLIGVRGRFGAVRGRIVIDRFHNSAMVDATIDTDMVSMRIHKYEAWVKSAEFFDVQHYPQIHFVSQSFPVERLHDGGEIEGVLSLRGVDKPITLELDPSGCPEAAAQACPAEAEGSIQRSAFGMRSRHGTVSDNVALGFSIYVLPSGSAAENIP